MTNIGRSIATIAAVLLVIGSAAFIVLRQPFVSEGLYQVKTALSRDAAAPEHHIVREDFQGWAAIHYAVEGAPPLREEDGALIVEYPGDGRLETSTPAPDDDGLLQRGYYRQTSSGLVPLSRMGDIWGEYSHRFFGNGQNAAGGRSSGFFVGTMAEFLATEWPAAHAEPRVSPTHERVQNRPTEEL